MNLLDRTLDLFERHKYGIIGTLMVHTALMFVMAISTIDRRTPEPAQEPIVLEFEDLEEELMPPSEEEAQAVPQQVTNLASNLTATPATAQQLSRRAQEQLAQNVEKELTDLERQEFERLAKERTEQGRDITIPKLDTTKFDKRNYMPKPTLPMKVEGLTTVAYDLAGRTDIVLEVPAYLCKGSGKIIVRVAVDRSGAVRKAELDPRSTSLTGCMAEHAMASASGARFSASSTAEQPQRGTITYIFLAQ